MRHVLGLAGSFETVETNVLLLKVKRRNSPGLKISSATVGKTDIGNPYFSAVKGQINSLAGALEENVFQIPVINRTGLTNFYDFNLSWQPLDPTSSKIDILNRALIDQLGLELVPSREPVEMLIVEKVR